MGLAEVWLLYNVGKRERERGENRKECPRGWENTGSRAEGRIDEVIRVTVRYWKGTTILWNSRFIGGYAR